MKYLEKINICYRTEKKRPWAMKTRRPFRGCIDKVEMTFEDKLKLAEEVAEKIELPLEENKKIYFLFLLMYS